MVGLIPIQSTSLRELVVEQVRKAIIEGRIKPGDHIVETRLTKQLGVSRTPVREALILLEREGLVVSELNRGSFVRVFTSEDIDHIFSMRTVLENFAAERAINRLDTKDVARLQTLIEDQRRYILQEDFKNVRSTDMAFHEYLVRAAQQPLLTRAWQELVAQIAAVLYLRAEGLPDYDEMKAIRDHESILQALNSRDLDTLKAHNLRINERVAEECKQGLKKKEE